MFRNLLALVAASRIVRMGLPIKGELKIIRIQASDPTIISLPVNLDTAVNGTQSLFFRNREGHLIVKPLERNDPRTRNFEVIQAFSDLPNVGEQVWLSGWLGNLPEDFGIQSYSTVDLANGTQAWQIPGDSDWVISVHGRNASRAECLRVAPLFQKLGYSNLIISHETDAKPAGLGKTRSYLAETEWQQIQQTVDFAKQSGARRVILFGWSLGCLFIGEYLRRVENTETVSKVIFDSPLLDYESTLNLQALNAGYSAEFGNYIFAKLKSSFILRGLGMQRKIVPNLFHDLKVPSLVFYSMLDGYVSMARIDEFAKVNPLANLEHFVGGRHCRLYNQDPTRYQSAIVNFLAD